MRSTRKLALMSAISLLLISGIGAGVVTAQSTPDPMALFLVEEVALELGCGEVLEEYLEIVDADDIKLFRLFVEPGSIIRVSVKDYGQAGDIWQACLSTCAQDTNVGTNVAIVPENCTTGDGNTFEYSMPASATADYGEMCLAVRNLEGVGTWPAHMWLKIEVQCGGSGMSGAVDAVIQSVLFGQLQGKQLYALPRTLAPGETVSGWNGAPLHVPGQAEWYVFIDLQPGANFEHPVQHAYVSASTGMITQVVESTTPPRNLFAEMQPVANPNVYGGAADIDTVMPAAYAQPSAPTPPAPPSTIPGDAETNPQPAPQNVGPNAFYGSPPPAVNNLYVEYGGAFTTVAATTVGGWLPVYVNVASPGTLWIYEYYQSTATWNIQPFVLGSSGWHKLWFYGDVAGWHTIIAYAGGSWTNWIHISVGGGAPPPTGCVTAPTSLNFGSVLVGASASQTFTLTNNTSGFKAGTILESCPDYTVSPNLYFLPPGASMTVTVTFAPTSSGTKTCSIFAGGSCGNVACTGIGGPPAAPTCTVSPTALSFGSVTPGFSSTQAFVVTNTGTGWLSGTITESCSEFSVSQNSFTLFPGASVSVSVTFSPLSTGSKSCTINVSGACSNVTCTGTGGPPPTPTCNVSPTNLSFGSVTPGFSSTQTFVVTNTGMSWMSGAVSESCLEFNVSPTGFVLSPGASVNVTVTFSPMSMGAKICTINVSGACANVTCTGTGGPPVVLGQKYALLLSGGVDSANNWPRYLNDLTEIYWALRNVYGYPASNIYVLYANGSGPSWVTTSATRANLFSTFAMLQGMMGSSDELMVFVTNHGGQTVAGTNQAKIWLWNYESIADWEFANQVNLLPSGAKKYFAFGQCYSGGMVDNLAGPNRHIATASGFNEPSWACDGNNDQGNCGSYAFDEFVLHWTAALNGSYPNAASLLSNADTNFDTTISLDEAFFYAQNWDTRSETPQRSDLGGIGGGGL